jgi:Icc-related predicted phosphoesterase
LDQARSRFQTATQRVSDLLTLLAEPQRDVRSDATAILHVSDIHGNPIGVDITAQLVEEFEVSAVIDTGDMGSSYLDTGELSTLSDSVEASIVRGIAGVDVPYLFVPGNHDSFGLRRRLDNLPNVEVLGGDAVTVGGITILGWADPTFTTRPIPEEEKSQIRLENAAEVATAVRTEVPHILAVHDRILATESIGRVPVVLSGHTHEHDIEEIDGTTLLTIGSTGATGLKSLTVETERPYEAEILYFMGTDLVAVDFIALRGVGGEFELERHQF